MTRSPSSLRGGDRDLLRAADDPVLLGAAVGRDEHVEAAAGMHVEQEVQQRQVRGLGGPDGFADQLEEALGTARVRVLGEPGGDGLAVPLGRLGRPPRRIERNLLGHPVEPRLRLRHVSQHERVQLRDRALVAGEATAVLELVEALVVGLEQLETQLADPVVDAQLRGADPLAADLDDRTVTERMVQRPPADAVTRFEDQH